MTGAPLPASRLRQPPHRRSTSAGPTGSDDQSSRKSQIPSWLPYAAAALIGVWLLQALVVPLLPRAAEIPYSEFKVKLSQLSAELLKAESLDGGAVREALSTAGHAVAS